MPEQFEGPRGKKRVPGGYKGAKKKRPRSIRRRRGKERVAGVGKGAKNIPRIM